GGRNLRDASAIPGCVKNVRSGIGHSSQCPRYRRVRSKIYQAQGNLEQSGKLLAGVNAQTTSFNALLTKMNQLFLERHCDDAIRFIHTRLTEPRDLPAFECLADQMFLALAHLCVGDINGARSTAQQL